VIATWMAASAAGEVDRVLELMTDDVVFLVAGQPPFGKEQFAASSRAMGGARFEGKSEVREVTVSGDLAFARSDLTVVVTTAKGDVVRRAGPALSIFRKEKGTWRLARDANLLVKA